VANNEGSKRHESSGEELQGSDQAEHNTGEDHADRTFHGAASLSGKGKIAEKKQFAWVEIVLKRTTGNRSNPGVGLIHRIAEDLIEGHSTWRTTL
jgi:hypothetical protein